MRANPLLVGALLVAGIGAGCAPPPPIEAGSEPEIRLLYPDSSQDFSLNSEGRLQFLVVVDIIGLEYVEPAEDLADVEGQGHWHVNLNDAYLSAPSNLYYEVDSAGFVSGDAVKLSATLQDNSHDDLDQYDSWQAILEFEIP